MFPMLHSAFLRFDDRSARRYLFLPLSLSLSRSLSHNLMYFVEKIMFQKKNFVEEVAWPSGLWGKHPEFTSV